MLSLFLARVHIHLPGSICDDQELIEQNIRETKLFSPDYNEKSAEEGTCLAH